MEIVGILSLIFSIIGLIASYWYVGSILCLVGIILGIFAATDDFTDKKFPTAGILLSVLGIVMSVYFAVSDLDSGKLLVQADKFKKQEKAEEVNDDFMRFHREGWTPDQEGVEIAKKETKEEMKETTDNKEEKPTPYWIHDGNETENNESDVGLENESISIQPEEKQIDDHNEENKESEEQSNYSESPSPISDFAYSISDGAIHLGRYIGDDKIVEITTSYNIDGINYPVDISEFQVGIGNGKAETIIFDEGFTELNIPTFNTCDVKNLYLPKSLTRVYDYTLAYLHTDGDEKINVFYGGTQNEWNNIFTKFQRKKIEDAEFGEELGRSIGDKINELIGVEYDSSDFNYYFSASPNDLR